MSGGRVARLAYFRVSTGDQSVEAQRAALGKGFDKEFVDHGVSGATPAAQRRGFAELLTYAREGDIVAVSAVDRLGRDAIDVQSTVRRLIERGVTVDVLGIGPIGRGVGELILAVLAQVADLERQRIRERCDSGRAAAKAALAETGLTHRGKRSLGRRPSADALAVRDWRSMNGASITATARKFGVSVATVKRYCAESAK
jgi:putative DNA-invertase from lambdoid prophage Rac